MFKKLQLFLSVLMASGLLFCSSVFAQGGSLSGTVTDANSGETLPGVNLFLLELERGTATDINGDYEITGLPNDTFTLRVTFVGYKRYETEISISGDTELNIELEEDLIGLEEVIVTGQGGASVEKKRLSTTVEVISAKDLETIPTTQLDRVLQANLPNSQIKLTSGQPGTASLIRGRGVNSALTSTNPVIYIDGVRVDNTTGFNQGIATGGAQSSAIADIPIENIERIEVVKGGAATTLYGSDAANGVIQIFTKKGVQGATRFTFETNIGAVKGTEDFLKYKETADILYRTGLSQEYKLSGSGGTENLTYSFSGSMYGNDGFRPNNTQVRHNVRATVRADINDWVSYTGSMGFVSNEFERDNNANSSFGSFGALEALQFGELSTLSDSEIQDVKDQIDEIQSLVDITEDVKRFQTSHQLQFDIMPGFTAKALVGLDGRTNRQRDLQTNAYLIALGAVAPGTVDQGSIELFERDFLGVTIEGSAQYQHDFGDFSSITVLGGQLFRTDDRQINALGSEVPDGVKTLNSAADVSTLDFRRTVANYGGYLQENLGYKDRYFVEFGLRVDGNTAFGEEVGAQLYPKVGVSYNLSSEPFFRDIISSSFISNLKLRANLGFAGNFPTPFSNQVLADIDPFLGTQSLEFGTPGDVNLKPEKSRTLEFGADFGFANDRISLEFTYFETVTEDALFNSRFAISTGFLNALQNVGEIENKGMEISARVYAIQTRDMGLSINASFNTLDNEVIKSGGSPFNVGGFTFLGNFVEEGKPVGYLRGNNPVFAADGSLESVEPNADLGSPIPDYYGTFGLNFNYRGLTLTVTSDYNIGSDVVNTDEVLRYIRGVPDDRIPENSIGESFFDLAGVWVEEGNYAKVRLIALDYAIPEKFYRDVVRRINVGFSILNPLNFVSSEIDPEVTGSALGGQGGGTEVGVGGFVYSTESQPRTFMGTVKINF